MVSSQQPPFSVHSSFKPRYAAGRQQSRQNIGIMHSECLTLCKHSRRGQPCSPQPDHLLVFAFDQPATNRGRQRNVSAMVPCERRKGKLCQTQTETGSPSNAKFSEAHAPRHSIPSWWVTDATSRSPDLSAPSVLGFSGPRPSQPTKRMPDLAHDPLAFSEGNSRKRISI